MSSLTGYLQKEFARLAGPEWCCRHEMALLPAELEDLLGYAPRADVLLERPDGSCRLWIEFEISRADPVANHAKFATAHLFRPQPSSDAFIAMISPHVARGRRNLAAITVQLMRRIGMSAFQTVLFPQKTGLEIQRLNHLSRDLLLVERPDVEPELERVLAVSQPVLTSDACRLHFAGDLSEVVINLRQWNEDNLSEEGAAQWGRRMVTYFVYDPRRRLFAPAKFCAYVPIPPAGYRPEDGNVKAGIMTIDAYSRLDQTTKIFDGTRARHHLTKRLGMAEYTSLERPDVAAVFELWLHSHNKTIGVSPAGPKFLVPPLWFG